VDNNGNQIKRLLLVITYAVVLYLALSNLNVIFSVLQNILSVLYPMILGVGIAYVLNLLMTLIEERLLGKVMKKTGKARKLKRALSVLLTFITVAALLTGLIMFVVPQVKSSAKLLGDSIPGLYNKAYAYVSSLAAEYNLTSDLLAKINENWKDIMNTLSAFLSNTVPQIFNLTVGLTTGVINLVLGITVSIYLLYSKEKLVLMLRKMLYAFTRKSFADKVSGIASMANATFSRFIGGQVTEAMILGTLCFIGMSIFRMPYPLLISMLIAVTALIPILGAYLGVIPSAFIILMENPLKALFFVIFIICLQQFEGSVIYPKVVGKSIGLSGLWVLTAITLGGSLFGLMGMLLGVPAFAVLYILTRNAVYHRLKEKKIVITPPGAGPAPVPQAEKDKPKEKPGRP